MRTHRLLMAALALGAVAPVVPTPVGSAPVVQEPSAPTQQKAVTPAPVAGLNMITRAIAGGAFLVSAKTRPIWVAKAKRGNRRNRSRWNYNR